MKPNFSVLGAFSAVCLLLLLGGSRGGAAESIVSATRSADEFALVGATGPAPIWFDAEDFAVVRIAARDFADDVERVAARKPVVSSAAEAPAAEVVIIGTLGRSRLIDDVVRAGKLDASHLAGKWETFLITTVEQPRPGVTRALVIAGSDRRGTAFGVYELSQQIGVSPWYWWADVPPKQKAEIYVRSGITMMGPPSVKYRGIFINDEDWGLQPWAAKTFAPEEGGIGPKVYRNVFELLLRLKANTLWPAMHACTKPFNAFPESKQLADDYGIVMGSSHAEPMLRNNVGEWTEPHEEYNYVSNRDGVLKYWEERVAANGRFENIYTVGMRGIHDSAIQGTKTDTERIRVLEQVFADQRALLAKHVSRDVERVPQMFCAYKEVLELYRQGLKVPDDVTIVWPDDNFGYIRNFATEEEQRTRTGGFGVYYHISYLGRPLAYLWLCTTPPALIWEEMSKAFDHGARQIWIVNVGDIKPAEIGTEFFLQMAWDINRWNRDTLPNFLEEWATREFGAEHGPVIAWELHDFFAENLHRKPEHLQWWLPGEAIRASGRARRLTPTNETGFRDLRLMYPPFAAEELDALFQLATYPIEAAQLARQRVFFGERAELYAQQGRAEAAMLLDAAIRADAELDRMTHDYNVATSGGKWKGIMALEPADEQWRSMRISRWHPPNLVGPEIRADADIGVVVSDIDEPLRDGSVTTTRSISRYRDGPVWIKVFDRGRTPAKWSITTSPDWLRAVPQMNAPRDELAIGVDWKTAPHGERLLGELVVSGAGRVYRLSVPVFNPAEPRAEDLTGCLVESNETVIFAAESFSRNVERREIGWRTLSGFRPLGTGYVAIFPTTAPGVDEARLATDAPRLEYDTYFFTPGEHALTANLIPTHSLVAGRGLRFAVGLDDQPPQVVVVPREVGDAAWAQGVLNNTVNGSTKIRVPAAGKHVLKIYMVDAGVVLDKIVIDCGGLKPSNLGPPETRVGD